MRIVLLVLLAALLCVRAAFAIDPTTLPDPQQQARYQKLTHELRCMQCLNQSIADSPVELAGELRNQVREMVVAGKTDDEIRDYMVARYGEFILFRPRFSARNVWLWFGPAIMLVIGAFIAVRIIRQRSKLVEQDNEPLEEEAAGR
ncbi:MAG TPA: cytochrome c-type biogenesis protein [Steroidobacteraceae bacterium]|jgi:cytochrome c-type biogenesis protein CcmH|nr:cytochrome c-type biogenesis protein [Steroidobacteraceae bacterium]